MTSLQLFEYSGNQVRTILIDGEPWFVLNDLCRILEISNPYNVASRIDHDALRKTEVIDSMGRTQDMSIVSEPGMYEVVIRSNGEVAKPFRKWIVSVVLPSIRKTGAYSAPKSLEEMTLEVMGALRSRVEEQVAVLEAQAPLVAQAETFRQADGLRTIGDLANDLKVHAASNFPGVKVHQQDIFDLAGELGMIIRGNTVRHNQPTARAIEAGWVKPKDVSFDTNTRGRQTKVSARLTPRGYGRLWDAATNRLRAGQPIQPIKEISA